MFYIIDIKHHNKAYELEELVREFLEPEDYIILNGRANIRSLSESGREPTGREIFKIEIRDSNTEREEAKRFIYNTLAEKTGYRPAWGTLTGVRPVKLYNEIMSGGLTDEETAGVFTDKYLVSGEKAELLSEVSRGQRFITDEDPGRSVGLYVGIPFCPARCLYCSFTSNQASSGEIREYIKALEKEISAVGKRLSGLGVPAESVYIGGGTPTVLSAEELGSLLRLIRSSFDVSCAKEFCVEAGRPDTITAEKLEVMRENGVSRISINPQTLNDETLRLIGRNHSAEDIRRAFELAGNSGIEHINSDIIAGLPGEGYREFMDTVRGVAELEPGSITVHTLAVKRASRLKEELPGYRHRGEEAARMVSDAKDFLEGAGYRPYYMYRQKHMADNLENVAYAKPGSESVYNIRIMDEHQTIAALGAGAISKAYYGEKNRLERIPNVSNFRVYIDRIDEMIERKEKGLYRAFCEEVLC